MVTKAVMISVALEMMISSECFSTGAADACLTICIDICLWIIEVYFWLPCVLKYCGMVYLLLFIGLLLLSEHVFIMPCFCVFVCVVSACLIISRELLPMENSLRDFPPDFKRHELSCSVLTVYFPGTATA